MTGLCERSLLLLTPQTNAPSACEIISLFCYQVVKSLSKACVCVFGFHSKKNALFSFVQKAVGAVRALTPTSSPLSSPSKHGDRFIPSRAGANWSVNFHRINVSLLQYTQHHAVSYQKNSVLKIKVLIVADRGTVLLLLFYHLSAFFFHLDATTSLKIQLGVIIYYFLFFGTGN